MTKTRIGTAMAVLSFTALLVAMPPALAQDGDMAPLLDRLERLERDVRLLNIQIARGTDGGGGEAEGAGEISGPAMARLAVRLTALEEEVRQLTGSAETLSHEIARLNSRFDTLVGDIDHRLTMLETGRATGMAEAMAGASAPAPAGAAESAAPPVVSRQTVPGSAPGVLGQISEKDLAAVKRPDGTDSDVAAPAGTATPSVPAVQAQSLAPAPEQAAPSGEAETATAGPILPPGSPQDRYAFAFGLLRKAEYDKAGRALTEFMQTHPDSPLAHNAHYWLGETFYVRGQYARAAEVFLDAFQKSPDGTKAPDTLLKLGMSLAQLDKTSEACASFDKLARDYPKASSAIKRTVQRERQRIGCQ
jgi:tol-pal system protein YbgF